jgi:putative two-component system response regulator
VYDALRTNRPYRGAWESARVLSYLEERSGTEFDPDVAGKFVRMMRELDDRVQRVER